LRGINKTCMTCLKEMDFDEDCECLKEVGRQVRAKALRNVRLRAGLKVAPEAQPSNRPAESELPLFRKTR
jgi:hypothetical protein